MTFRIPRRAHILVGFASSLAVGSVAQAMPTSDYLKAAGASDMYEKRASQMVLQTTQNPKIRAFANEMIRDHTKSTAEVKAAAAKSGVTPGAPMLAPKQQSMLAELGTARGLARDNMYVGQQKTAHQEALATHRDYAATGDKPALKATAARIVPVVQQHIAMLDKM